MKSKYELRYRFNHPTQKICKDDADRGHETYKIFLARNEAEGCSLTFWTNDPIDGLTLEVDDFRSPDGVRLKPVVFRLAYIPVRGRPTPDAALPNHGEFAVSRDNSQMFFIRLFAPGDAPAGEYRSRFYVYKDGEVISEAALSARIWAFTLPDMPSCGTLFGLQKNYIEQNHGVTGAESDRLYELYYNMMLDYKICSYRLPLDILDPRADKYLDDPRITSFVIPYSEDDDVLRACRKKLGSKPEWFKKGVFYPVDEPKGPESFQRYEAACKRLEQLYPGYNIITPIAESFFFENGEDSISLLARYQTRWCPRSDMFDLNGIAGYVDREMENTLNNRDAILQKFGNMLDRMVREKAGGDEMWWYVCGYPYLMSYCDLNIDNTGAQHRVLFWQQYGFGAEGLLYWSTNYWKNEGCPWTNPHNYDKIRYGDGSLLYNGNEVGIDGPVGSLRLELIRDGIEDFEYLKLAEKLLSRESLLQIINRVINPAPEMNMALQGTDTPGICTFNGDDNNLYQVRISLGSAIEKALAQK